MVDMACPCLTVEVRTETFQVDTNAAEEPERTRLYNKMFETMPGFDDYRRRKERVIPVYSQLESAEAVLQAG